MLVQHSDRDDDWCCVRARSEGSQEATAARHLLHSHRQANNNMQAVQTLQCDVAFLVSTLCIMLGHQSASNSFTSCLNDKEAGMCL